MANICTNYVTITGNEKSLKDLRERINEQDPTLIDDSVCGHLQSTTAEGVAYGLESDLPLDGDGAVELVISSKWSPPEDDFERLSALYPSLTIEVRYEEPGNGYFGVSVFQEGSRVLDEPMEEFEYRMKYDDDFKDFVKDIKDKDYDYFKKEYIIGETYMDEYVWETSSYLLAPLIVKRTKAEDLPLLIGKSDLVDDLVKARLAGKQ